MNSESLLGHISGCFTACELHPCSNQSLKDFPYVNSFSEQLHPHSEQCSTVSSARLYRLQSSDVCSRLGSDFVPRVSKGTIQAVAASTASCLLTSLGHFPGLFCSAKDKGWLLAIPGDKEWTSVACLLASGISFNGKAYLLHGTMAREGYPVSLGFLLPPFLLLLWELPSGTPYQQQCQPALNQGQEPDFHPCQNPLSDIGKTGSG